MPEFICQPGYCVKCCTDVSILPVTLGDLYRTWIYRQNTGENTSFHNIFRELCNDWALVPSSDDSNVWATPTSKMPCRNLDRTEKKCSVHGVAKYVGCSLFPEDFLLPAPKGYHDDDKTLAFLKSLDCFRGITLSEERKGRLLELRNLMDREIHITVRLLESTVPSYSFKGAKPSKRAQRELFERIRFIGQNKDALRTVRKNLVENRILQDYEKLVMTENPGFSYCDEI
jgi:hypothetical protein